MNMFDYQSQDIITDEGAEFFINWIMPALLVAIVAGIAIYLYGF
jgi:hypothetical protein